MSPVNLTARALFEFLKVRLDKLKNDISVVAGFHRRNDVPHMIETITRVNVIMKDEIEFIFDHWMPFYHHSTRPLSSPAMKVFDVLHKILTVKFNIIARPVTTETVALLLIEYDRLNTLIPIAIAELDGLIQVLINEGIDPPILGPLPPQPPQGNQVHPLDMAAAKIYFKTYRKKHRKPRKSRKSRKPRKSRKSGKLRKSRKPRK
jgi:hypothetical protein